MKLVLTLTDEATARGPREAPELLVASFVKPDQPIAEPRATRRAVYRLTDRAGALTTVPSTAGQTAEKRGDAWLITVSTAEPPATSLDEAEIFLKPSAYLDYGNARVKALVLQALKGAEPNNASRAEAMRSFVHRYVATYDLTTGFASASEVAIAKRGDCTESAVLLAALLRNAAIPSRVVSGLLYVEEFAGAKNVFGHHMWVQGYIDGRWLDLDPITSGRFDAAHIALATSALDQPQGLSTTEALAAMANARLAVAVVEVDR
jgi:transglutaminase-like putative cysteine protease